MSAEFDICLSHAQYSLLRPEEKHLSHLANGAAECWRRWWPHAAPESGYWSLRARLAKIGGEVVDFRTGEWYAVHVRSRHEKLVFSTLGSKGFDCFLPTYKTKRRWSDRIAEVEFPLFAGYVFSSFGPQDHISVLKSAGVVTVVSFAQRLAPVDPGELEQVQRILASGSLVLPWPYLSAGEPVYLDNGPLRGLQGIVLRIKDSLRLVVSLSLLQRSIAVEVDRTWVRPIRRNVAEPLPAFSMARVS